MLDWNKPLQVGAQPLNDEYDDHTTEIFHDKESGNRIISWETSRVNYAMVDKNGMLIATLHQGSTFSRDPYGTIPFVTNKPLKDHIVLKKNDAGQWVQYEPVGTVLGTMTKEVAQRYFDENPTKRRMVKIETITTRKE